MKKIAAIAALAALLVVLLLAIFAFSGKEEPAPESAPIAITGEMTIPTTEVTSPGLEDSIFDDEPEETTKATLAAEETKPTQPKPTEPKPTQPRPTEPEPIDPEPNTPKPNVPKPTEPKPTEPKPTEPSEPAGTTEATQPEESVSSDSNLTEFEKFQNLPPAEQQKYMESFPSIDAFFAWYNAAREEYEKANPPIDVGDGTIDMGAIIAGKN